MTAPKRYRWTCPTCSSGVLAPSKPRRDDVRRYCLDCSARTGRLVERTCPALDKQRGERQQRAAAKTTTARQRARDAERAKHTVGDLDLLAEARRFWKLPTIVDARQRYRPRVTKLPTIEWRRSKSKWHTSGRCWPMSQRIVVTLGTYPGDAAGTVLHELVHAVMPSAEHHGTLFRSTLRSAAAEAWPEGFTAHRNDMIVHPLTADG